MALLRHCLATRGRGRGRGNSVSEDSNALQYVVMASAHHQQQQYTRNGIKVFRIVVLGEGGVGKSGELQGGVEC